MKKFSIEYLIKNNYLNNFESAKLTFEDVLQKMEKGKGFLSIEELKAIRSNKKLNNKEYEKYRGLFENLYIVLLTIHQNYGEYKQKCSDINNLIIHIYSILKLIYYKDNFSNESIDNEIKIINEFKNSIILLNFQRKELNCKILGMYETIKAGTKIIEIKDLLYQSDAIIEKIKGQDMAINEKVELLDSIFKQIQNFKLIKGIKYNGYYKKSIVNNDTPIFSDELMEICYKINNFY